MARAGRVCWLLNAFLSQCYLEMCIPKFLTSMDGGLWAFTRPVKEFKYSVPFSLYARLWWFQWNLRSSSTYLCSLDSASKGMHRLLSTVQKPSPPTGCGPALWLNCPHCVQGVHVGKPVCFSFLGGASIFMWCAALGWLIKLRCVVEWS